jgi:DNA topoisomerase-1
LAEIDGCSVNAFEESQQMLAHPDMAAAAAGLRYVSDEETPGISRQKRGLGFAYRSPEGKLIRDDATLARIRSLAIPPAWTSVWIAPIANSHLAATGRDVKGRKQYRYNPEFIQIRGAAKYGHVVQFAQALPKIREQAAAHLSKPGMPRDKVLASIITLLEWTLIRVGNEDYVKQNGSFGLTTLRDRHVQIVGSELRFLFPGKSGKTWRLSIQDRRVANIVKSCQDLPGQHLFQYVDSDGAPQKVTSSDVNEYLREASGRAVTAKDFRTWAGTVEAAVAFHRLVADGKAPLKKHVRMVVEQVAAKLGNTPTICRKCYVHPEVISSFEKGTLKLKIRKSRSEARFGLTAEERAVLNFLKSSLS